MSTPSVGRHGRHHPDICSVLTSSTDIKAGTLIKDDHFSLFEAVGALEIGDPKMDSGCLEPDESLDEEFDMNRDFRPAELIWLMDEMLDREVAWLMGYPLSQTLFTSVHIDRLLWPVHASLDYSNFVNGQQPQDNYLSHQILRSYCFLLIKICDLVLGMVTSQHYYEVSLFFSLASPLTYSTKGRRLHNTALQ